MGSFISKNTKCFRSIRVCDNINNNKTNEKTMDSIQNKPTENKPMDPEIDIKLKNDSKIIHLNDINIMKAVKENNTPLVIKYINNSGNLNYRGMWKSTPLIYACQYKMNEIALLLINNNADLSLRNERGAHALLLACIENMYDIILIILNKNPSFIHLFPPGFVYNSFTDQNSRLTPLLAICTNGYLNILELFILYKINVNEIVSTSSHEKDNNNNINNMYSFGIGNELTCSILVATQYNHIDIVKILLKNDVNLFVMDYYGKNPLYLACENTNEELGMNLWIYLMNELKNNKIQKDKINLFIRQKDSIQYYSLFHLAIQNGMIQLVKEIIQYDKTLIYTKTGNGISNNNISNDNSFFLACKTSNHEMILDLLNYYDTKNVINEKNQDDMTIMDILENQENCLDIVEAIKLKSIKDSEIRNVSEYKVNDKENDILLKNDTDNLSTNENSVFMKDNRKILDIKNTKYINPFTKSNSTTNLRTERHITSRLPPLLTNNNKIIPLHILPTK